MPNIIGLGTNPSGGGGVTETVIVTVPISPHNPGIDKANTATYTNASGEIVSGVSAGFATQCTVLKGSIFFLLGYLKDLGDLKSPANYGRVSSMGATDQRFYSNDREGVFFVADTDITVVY